MRVAATIYSEVEPSIAARLPDILEAAGAALPASVLGDIARAVGVSEIANTAVGRFALHSARRWVSLRLACSGLGQSQVRGPGSSELCPE